MRLPAVETPADRATSRASGIVSHPLVLITAWIAAHAVALLVLLRHPAVFADIHYYYRGVNKLQRLAMNEYPEVGTWPVKVLNSFTWSETAFVLAFIIAAVGSSAVFTGFLYHVDPDLHRRAVWFWIAFIAVSGPIVETRLDIYPALAVAGCAAMLFSRRPLIVRCATVLLAVATMMKLWPGMLAAGLVGVYRRAETWVRVGGFLTSLAVLSLIVAVVYGPERLLSPLTYQGDRGLQVESLLAAPLVLTAAILHSDRWDIYDAPSKSIEIFGPGVGAAIAITTVLTLLTVLGALWWAVMRLRRDDWTPTLALSSMMLVIVLVILSNKVFSPQYVTWLAPITAVALVVAGNRSQVRWIAGSVLVLAALTTLVFPLYYDAIILRTPPSSAAAVLLIARAVVAVATAVGCWRWILSQLRANRQTTDPHI